jgi:hypothetical protein
MKKLYLFKLMSLLLLALTFKNSFAQVIPPTAEIDYSFYNRMNYVFSPLEKTHSSFWPLKRFRHGVSFITNQAPSNDFLYLDIFFKY